MTGPRGISAGRLLVQETPDEFQILLGDEQMIIPRPITSVLGLRRTLIEFFSRNSKIPDMLIREALELLARSGVTLPQSTMIEIPGGQITVEVSDWYRVRGEIRLILPSGTYFRLDVPVADGKSAEFCKWARGRRISASHAAIRANKYLLEQGLCATAPSPRLPTDFYLGTGTPRLGYTPGDNNRRGFTANSSGRHPN